MSLTASNDIRIDANDDQLVQYLHLLPHNKCPKVKAPRPTTRYKEGLLLNFLRVVLHLLYLRPHDHRRIECQWIALRYLSHPSHPLKRRTNVLLAFHLQFLVQLLLHQFQSLRLQCLQQLPRKVEPLHPLRRPQHRPRGKERQTHCIDG